jgi:hypothetical protein
LGASGGNEHCIVDIDCGMVPAIGFFAKFFILLSLKPNYFLFACSSHMSNRFIGLYK